MTPAPALSASEACKRAQAEHLQLPWMQLDADFLESPKVLDLRVRLRDRHAAMYVLGLYQWAWRHRQTARFEEHEAGLIELACGWSGEPGELFPKLIAARILEIDAEGVVSIHGAEERWGAQYSRTFRDRDRHPTRSGKNTGDSVSAEFPRSFHGASMVEKESKSKKIKDPPPPAAVISERRKSPQERQQAPPLPLCPPERLPALLEAVAALENASAEAFPRPIRERLGERLRFKLEPELVQLLDAHDGDMAWVLDTQAQWIARGGKYVSSLNPPAAPEVFIRASQWPQFQGERPPPPPSQEEELSEAVWRASWLETVRQEEESRRKRQAALYGHQEQAA